MMKWPKSITELPDKPTFIIIEISSITYDDPYERPGSGNTYTDRFPSIITFETEEEWKEEIAKRMDSTRSYFQKKEFKAYKLLPANVKMSVNIEVQEWQS